MKYLKRLWHYLFFVGLGVGVAFYYVLLLGDLDNESWDIWNSDTLD